MSWRTVVVSKKSKASYKDGYMIVKNESEAIIHLSEVSTVIFESTAINITSYLLCELISSKIKVIFCDHKRNPYGEIVPYYGRYNVSKRIAQQIGWPKTIKQQMWAKIVRQKILNQATVLRKKGFVAECEMLKRYAGEIVGADETNREGHAAKVYFNALFGKKFTRPGDNLVNGALDYGYSILLSNFNREIANLGYLTTLGINHSNEFNQFNLTSDLMEVFRPIVDEFVFENRHLALNSDYKVSLIDLMNKKVEYDDQNQFVSSAISLYAKSFFKAIENENPDEFIVFKMK